MTLDDHSRDLRFPEPHTFSRRVLLAVTGLSPQVVTETLYALTQKLKPAFVPTEVHLLTTAEGAERARLTLLSDDPGWFHRLRRDYDLPEIDFTEHNIHVIKTPDGIPIDDIRTREENERVADLLIEKIHELTTDPNCALHVSIAGGRKTMGFYAGYAISLLGRPQDRLSHVLVGIPFESKHEFFYPTPYPRVIHAQDNRPLDTSKAEVGLADIPFVRLRPGMDDRLLSGNATFSEVVAAAQRALGPPVLEFDLDQQWIDAGGQRVHLPPALLAFLSWLARRARAGKPGIKCPEKSELNLEYKHEYLSEYAHLGDELNSSIAMRLGAGMDKAFFEQTKSKLHRVLKDTLGPEGVRRYGVRDNGHRPRLYSIAAPPESIHWSGGLDEPDVPLRKLAEPPSDVRRPL
ncbi:MAG: TIGR02584 family CRISPR-associated protein [Acidobacteria bacterium]|nr:TIGR02584 family CRISPR-associated protein [Acidobacteriota bacterium]